ncbi:hypothetical protein [Rhizobium ruizarguesonis]|uniref:hypothetical protein n=1 Tax=Rhizobium ruizarguesonis TaxID=2081791 RepID=UPI00102FECE5|nr:hypothetical protein [Rhizobium ruizarguesonis]TBB88091.1 hypothetical protein ELH41_15245 [Rhizobium ruizarguesonis]TBC45052.1 hypothetical protein ELH31_15405 [Rhizobium ruizarguesonis]
MTGSNLPAAQPDISRAASDTEKLVVLTRLFAVYPCRAPSDFRLVRPAYMQALEAVGQWALFEAERRINQNALGHPFMATPAELRREIDRVMEPFRERERRAAEDERRYRWAEDDKPRALAAPQGDPEAVANWRVRRAAQKVQAAVKSAGAPVDRALFAHKDERMTRTAADAVDNFMSRQSRHHYRYSERGEEFGHAQPDRPANCGAKAHG